MQISSWKGGNCWYRVTWEEFWQRGRENADGKAYLPVSLPLQGLSCVPWTSPWLPSPRQRPPLALTRASLWAASLICSEALQVARVSLWKTTMDHITPLLKALLWLLRALGIKPSMTRPPLWLHLTPPLCSAPCSPAVLCQPVATGHTGLLSTCNVASPSWDVLVHIEYTLALKALVQKRA